MQRISVALPDSALLDEQTKRDKTIKIGQFARACSIFRVSKIHIYHDSLSRFDVSDGKLMSTVLSYLDTPQYLRKALFPKLSQLEYAGILHPIKAPHHKPSQNVTEVKRGDVRSGIILKNNGALAVDIGLSIPVPFEGAGKEGQKVDALIISEHPRLRARQARSTEIKGYWGFDVKLESSLSSLLAAEQNSLILLTSRKGAVYSSQVNILEQRLKNAENLLVVFGSPRYGIHDILSRENPKKQSIHEIPNHLVANMFPGQATETVRLEEAVLATLAILNLITYRTAFSEKLADRV